VGALGTASAIFFSLDAFASASQARALMAVGRVRDGSGAAVTTFGVTWRF
jgi:hypothetical protein